MFSKQTPNGNKTKARKDHHSQYILKINQDKVFMRMANLQSNLTY